MQVTQSASSSALRHSASTPDLPLAYSIHKKNPHDARTFGDRRYVQGGPECSRESSYVASRERVSGFQGRHEVLGGGCQEREKAKADSLRSLGRSSIRHFWAGGVTGSYSFKPQLSLRPSSSHHPNRPTTSFHHLNHLPNHQSPSNQHVSSL